MLDFATYNSFVLTNKVVRYMWVLANVSMTRGKFGALYDMVHNSV